MPVVLVAALVAAKAAQLHWWPDPDGARLWPGLVRQALLVGVLLVLLVRRAGWRRASADAGLTWNRAGLAGAAVLGGVAAALAVAGAPSPWSTVNLVVVTALGEEVIFRGVLPRLVWRRGAASAAFGSWHLPDVLGDGLLTVVGVLVFTTGAALVVLGPLRRRTGTVLAPAAVHGATNGVGLLLTGW